jgi:NAD(P)-dependent dehydrogenase (short-subunit alcohol dehydrogenase family)
MQDGLAGQVALFTGAINPITVTVARWLGNEGVRQVFAGPEISRDPLIESLLYQFRRDILCMDEMVDDPASVQRLAESVESACGRVDMVFHTLGSQRQRAALDAFSVGAGAGLALNAAAPLMSALTCSSGAIRHLSQQDRGHMIHLVTRAEVGAIEVENMVLDRIRRLLAQEGKGAHVRMSAIYFDGTAARQIAGPAAAVETRLLDENTGRLVEEDGWIARVMTERAIGDMVRQVCRETPGAMIPGMESIDFHGGVQPSVERHAIQ